MSFAEFRLIESSPGPDRADKLFRAAVSAFCALQRPSRAEVAQLDDLAMPLVANVSHESRRFAAAALSECPHAPPLLVRYLAGEPADIAAPLLIRSRELRDADLIVCIARRGIGHARVIARRPRLPKAIEDLLTALRDPEIERLRTLSDRGDAAPAERLAETRSRLKALMRPSDPATLYRDMRDAALTGRRSLLEARLADALGLDSTAAGRILKGDPVDFAVAMKALGISFEQAFLLLCAIHPGRLAGPVAIRLFLRQYETLEPEAALSAVRSWKLGTVDRPGQDKTHTA